MRSGYVVLIALVACTGADKTEVADDLSELGAAGGKADHFERMIVGSLDYGQTSEPVAYHFPPRYRIFKFAGDPGDVVDVRVTSADGDAMAWVLDDSFAVLGYNDDASASTFDAAIHLELPAHPSRTHYIVFRDYHRDDATFQVQLDGEPAGCMRDADCVMVEAGCCPVGAWVAILGRDAEAFEAAKDCAAAPICPLRPIRNLGQQALCDVDTHTCEVVLPADVACGGRSLNPHSCPDGWQCVGPALQVDGFGSCVQTCGGFAFRPCPDDLECVDDPNDDCDPAAGGADCGGLCQ